MAVPTIIATGLRAVGVGRQRGRMSSRPRRSNRWQLNCRGQCPPSPIPEWVPPIEREAAIFLKDDLESLAPHVWHVIASGFA
jgi:hypothetical protein